MLLPGCSHLNLSKLPPYLTCSQPYHLVPPSPVAPSPPPALLYIFMPSCKITQFSGLPALAAPPAGPLCSSWLSFLHLCLCSWLLVWLSLPQLQFLGEPSLRMTNHYHAHRLLHRGIFGKSPCLSLPSPTLITVSPLKPTTNPNIWLSLLFIYLFGCTGF